MNAQVVPNAANLSRGKEANLAMGPVRRPDHKSAPFSEIDVLWITAGLGCYGTPSP